MEKISNNVIGLVNNLHLDYNKGIIAIFEAISNSIHSIEDAKNKEGRIDIELTYDQDQISIDGETNIKKIRISDNGIGFNETEYKSFKTANSTHKIKKGGKGNGRFTWLKVFKEVKIESIYKSNEKTFKRNFDFELTENGINNDQNIEFQSDQIYTTITFNSIYPKYSKKFQHNFEGFIREIVDHFLGLFVSSNIPTICVSSNIHQEVDLTNYFKNNLIVDSEVENIKIDDIDFILKFIKIKDLENYSENSIILSSSNRIVEKFNYKEFLPDLKKPLFDKKLALQYKLFSIAESPYLDQNVNLSRTKFNFPDKIKNKQNSSFPLSLEEITHKVVEITLEKYKEHIKELQKSKFIRIEQKIKNELPQYRSLLKHKNYLNSIDPDVNESKLEIALYQAHSRLRSDTKERIELIINSNENEFNESELSSIIEQVNDEGQSALIDHVIHRKKVIQLLNKFIYADETGKMSKEEKVHNLIFPMRVESDNINFEDHNLWLIDDKLAFHSYLSSDIQLTKGKHGKPDLLILTDNIETPLNSVVIVELKRPGRKDYTLDENPHTQLINLKDKFEEGKIKIKGRQVKVSTSCKFYLYGICDIDQGSNLETIFTKHLGLFPSINKDSYFNMKGNAFIEIMTFDKLLKDARDRNRVLFEKLNLPENI